MAGIPGFLWVAKPGAGIVGPGEGTPCCFPVLNVPLGQGRLWTSQGRGSAWLKWQSPQVPKASFRARWGTFPSGTMHTPC